MAVKICLDCKHVFTIQPFKSSSIYKFHCGCIQTFSFGGEDNAGKDDRDTKPVLRSKSKAVK